MAQLYPKHPRKNATRGERRVLERLQSLDDHWYVLHSLDYAEPGPGRTGMRETDFLLVHRRFGALVIEVKDGRYKVEKRRWSAIRRDGTEFELTKTPFQQAKDNRFALSNLIKDRAGIRRPPIGHCVLFTDGRPSGPLGLDAPDEIVLSEASLSPLPGPAIRSVLDYWQLGTWSTDDEFGRALAVLCPTSVIAPSLCYTMDISASDLEQETARQIEWTTEQLDALRAASASQLTLVLGAAGTGKTVIAQERARSLAASGNTVALMGQPQHLRLQLRRKMHLRGVRCGDPADILAQLYGPTALTDFEGEHHWVAAMALAEEHGPKLDDLVIDEAQSHDSDVLEAMRGVVRPGGSVLLLADPYQRDSEGSWKPDDDYERVWLTRNCRNVHPIARLVARLSGVEGPRSGVDGARPVFTASDDVEADGVGVVRTLLSELRTPNRIVVLTENATTQQKMRSALLRARVQVAVSLGEPGLLVCTVNSFRGCEADAVVYVTEVPQVHDRTIDYIAVSRACAYLHVVGPRARWNEEAYLMGDQP